MSFASDSSFHLSSRTTILLLNFFFSSQMKDPFRNIMETMVKYDTFKAIWPHCIFVSVHFFHSENHLQKEDGLPCMSQVEQQL